MASGRPSKYSKSLSDKICERLADGESMRSVSRDESMPAMSTLFKWLREKPQFSQQYAIAKKECALAYFEDIVDIADNDASQPLMYEDGPVMVDGEPVMIKDNASINHAKLRIDARKWCAARLAPQKYGEKSTGTEGSVVVNNIMPVPTAASVDSWEQQAEKHQKKLLDA